jgi:hypothetical protein
VSHARLSRWSIHLVEILELLCADLLGPPSQMMLDDLEQRLVENDDQIICKNKFRQLGGTSPI